MVEIPNEGDFMRRTRIAPCALLATYGLTLVLAALLLGSSVHAAEVTASLLGTVRDASGAVVGGATISLTNTQTNVSQKLQSGTMAVIRSPLSRWDSTD